MKESFEVLFYLDNSDLSIIEVGQTKSPDMKSLYRTCFWFMYSKTSNSITRFIFKANASRLKLREKRIKKGLLKPRSLSGTDGYIIEIDEKAFDFIEQRPENLPKETKATLEKYLSIML